MRLFLLLVILPIAEIALMIEIGQVIGTPPVIGIMLLTAFFGTIMLRSQGTSALGNLRNSLSGNENPVHHIAHGAMILASGLLLVTPGFITDAVGLALLLPPVRKALIKWGGTRMMTSENIHIYTNTPQDEPQENPQSNTIDGEFDVIDDDQEPGDSGWTKH